MSSKHTPKTGIGYSTEDQIFVNGMNLVDDVMGKFTFTDFIYLHLTGARPTPSQAALLDVVLVTLMEHGLTPSAIVTRLIYHSAPEAIQAAVAAGLTGVGSTFIGTMEGCSALLDEMLTAPEGSQLRARAIAERHRAERRPIHGFGHPIHKPDDPRSARMLSLAEQHHVPGRHIAALRELSAEVDRAYGRHLTINATGASAALLGEIGIPGNIMRGVALISRSAGLVGHIREEMRDPAARHIWGIVESTIPYEREQDGE